MRVCSVRVRIPLAALETRATFAFMRNKLSDEERKARRKVYNDSIYKRDPLVWRKSHLRRKYGMTLESYNELLAKQGYKCAACKSTDPKSKDGWNVDHDHDTKAVRGIICADCNRFLGSTHDPETGERDNLIALEVSYRNMKNYLMAHESASVDTYLSSK